MKSLNTFPIRAPKSARDKTVGSAIFHASFEANADVRMLFKWKCILLDTFNLHPYLTKSLCN